ncbi:hypothetical protein M2459_002827 [Parabacteroides sp. PF5-5]|uniref:hypothetical protein n=1 Tax=unclassified Parabacteroides TaxID=2649774 RepID=UPI0024750864|nr:MULTISPECIES: hypothetical protein [unclassified Parabacteroides]MDH6306029.1 hypothetical protein [Parabacteroides sp. PH5-39]MDH6317073.1 hypothetical protein [Parabacteroides sp. PF5-13]MDH6320826.1 hypothetical protein [Parabacteroides sp. PH5-13]MDH6324472.1 hypothetical protein [Parabacteroides sp. PH5-8]MDH6328258.1 hypothetical protein [Parabacteroides sp. PH5-41]
MYVFALQRPGVGTYNRRDVVPFVRPYSRRGVRQSLTTDGRISRPPYERMIDFSALRSYLRPHFPTVGYPYFPTADYMFLRTVVCPYLHTSA